MALSSAQQIAIEHYVNSASPEELAELRGSAEADLHAINGLMSQKVLSKAENQVAEAAIEALVRIECRENGKGWWFRLKRRTQLLQTFLGNGNTATGFAIKGEVNDRAVQLKTLVDMAKRYLDLPTDALNAAVQRDFPGQQSAVENDCATFVYPDAPEFQFYINHTDLEASKRSLMVRGRGELTGYVLHVNDGGTNWFSVASDGPLTSATGAARKLAKTMQTKFGIDDLSRLAIKW